MARVKKGVNAHKRHRKVIKMLRAFTALSTAHSRQLSRQQ